MAITLIWYENAFLHGDLEKELYMKIPQGFVASQARTIWKLNKAIYGLKQSLRAWFEPFI